MEVRLIDKEDILSSGKKYSKVRVPNTGASLIGFIYKGWDYPFQPKISHSNISVYHIGRYALNKSYRDTVLVEVKSKTVRIQWEFRLDDYVSGGVLDLWQLQIDVDNAIAVFGRNNLSEIIRYIQCNAKKLTAYVG